MSRWTAEARCFLHCLLRFHRSANLCRQVGLKEVELTRLWCHDCGRVFYDAATEARRVREATRRRESA